MKLSRKLLIISVLYFAEGFPPGILKDTFPLYFRIHGMSLVDYGLLSLLTIPYSIKVLWAPAVDFLGARRHWITAAQFMMAGAIMLVIPLDPANPSAFLWVCLASFAVLSATQDVAIDAYSIELLKPSEMGVANGFRQAAYRVAVVVAGGLFVALGGWMGWRFTFTAAAAALCVCAVISLRLPHVEVTRPAFSLKAALTPLQDLLTRPRAVSVILFILLYKLGDSSMGHMVKAFWLHAGLSATEIGLITGTLGIVAAIAGGLAGGWFVDRFGIFHGLWFLGLWQSVSNLTYAVVAGYPEIGKWGIYCASIAESFCGGLGTAAFLAFLMSICRKEFSATQYALLSALFMASATFAGAFGGWGAEQMGYANYFALTFVLSLPAFLFILSTRTWIPTNGEAQPAVSSELAE